MKSTIVTLALAVTFTIGGAGLLWGAYGSFRAKLVAHAATAPRASDSWLLRRERAPSLQDHLDRAAPPSSMFMSPGGVWARGLSFMSGLARPEEWAIGGPFTPDTAAPGGGYAEGLTGPDPQARLKAAEALWRHGTEADVPALEAALGDVDLRVSGTAALALAAIGSREALRSLLRAPFAGLASAEPYGDTFRAGAPVMQWRRAAAHLGRSHPDVLEEWLEAAPPGGQLRAALAASRASHIAKGEEAAALGAILTASLDHPNRKVRQFAAAGLAALKNPGAVASLKDTLYRRGEGADALLKMGTDESRAVVTEFLLAMDRWGAERIGQLLAYLEAGEALPASQAARVLARLGGTKAEAALAGGLGAGELEVALVCADSLARMKARGRLPDLLEMVARRGHGYQAALELDGDRAYAAFHEMWRTGGDETRAQALRGIAAAKRGKDLPLILGATRDGAADVRAAALGCLTQYPERRDTSKRIIALLNDEDPQVRRVARWVCQSLRRPEFAVPLLKLGADGKYPEHVRGAIGAVSGMGPEELQIQRWQALGFNFGGGVSLGIGLLLFALGAGPPVQAWARARRVEAPAG